MRACAALQPNAPVTSYFFAQIGAIPYSRVVQVMGALNAGGFANIVLVTDGGGPRMDAGAGTAGN